MFILNKYKALGTYWYLKCEDALSESELETIRFYLIDVITSFENSYSRFVETSELSILNKNKHLPNASSDLLEMLEMSLKFNEETENYFNIAVGGELEKLGYTGDFSFSKEGRREKVPYLNEILTLKSREVILDNKYNLDLGGIGKSFLIKKLSNTLLSKFGLKKFLINVGGDIYTSYSQDMYIQNPVNVSKYLSKIHVEKGGVATSTPFLRSWKQGNSRVHHLVNPNRVDTELTYLSATVVCDDIISADIWAKALLLSNLSVEVKRSGIDVYIVDSDFNVIHLK